MNPNQTKLIKTGIIIFVVFVLFLIFNPLVKISAGERGVVLNFGAVSDKILSEGLHWRTPIMQKVVQLDVKTVKHEIEAISYSKDIQTVDAKVALNYHLDPNNVNKLWQEIGKNYQERIIDPSIQESVKAATAQFTAQELIEQRPKVKEEIKKQLFERLNGRHIIVDDFSIVNFDFSEEYEAAVERKQIAQQDALTAKNKLEQVKMEAEQRVAQAQGEAKAIQIQAQAITQQGGKDYVNLKWIEAWGKGGAQVPQFVTSDNAGGFIFNLSK